MTPEELLVRNRRRILEEQKKGESISQRIRKGFRRLQNLQPIQQRQYPQQPREYSQQPPQPRLSPQKEINIPQSPQQFQPQHVADSRGNTLTLVTGNTIPIKQLRFWNAN